MFERDSHSLNPGASSKHLPGGVAPTRQALEKQRIMEERIARLDAERMERRRVHIQNRYGAVTGFLSQILSFLGVAIGRKRMPLSKQE